LPILRKFAGFVSGKGKGYKIKAFQPSKPFSEPWEWYMYLHLLHFDGNMEPMRKKIVTKKTDPNHPIFKTAPRPSCKGYFFFATKLHYARKSLWKPGGATGFQSVAKLFRKKVNLTMTDPWDTNGIFTYEFIIKIYQNLMVNVGK